MLVRVDTHRFTVMCHRHWQCYPLVRRLGYGILRDVG
jgi:hypothetical protein